MEKVAYGILGGMAGAWIMGMIIGLVAVIPWGLIVLIALLSLGGLIIRTLKAPPHPKADITG